METWNHLAWIDTAKNYELCGQFFLIKLSINIKGNFEFIYWEIVFLLMITQNLFNSSGWVKFWQLYVIECETLMWMK